VQRVVNLRAYPEYLLVVEPDGQTARLERHFGREQTIYDWQHYIALVERKPRALRNGALFRDMPEPLGGVAASIAQTHRRGQSDGDGAGTDGGELTRARRSIGGH
jgi:hypothetical protein